MAAERILIVDDDESIRQIVRICLSDEGYEVLEAPNGRVALEMVTASAPRLILLDLRMPVMDGWEFAKRYESMPGPRAPVVAFFAALNVEQDCADLDAAGILANPFDLDDLLRAVRDVLPMPT
ncbi:MAG: response regulator [Chloroflexota bacterium]|nr:response regulator [Chloroflexota bacterium]